MAFGLQPPKDAFRLVWGWLQQIDGICELKFVWEQMLFFGLFGLEDLVCSLIKKNTLAFIFKTAYWTSFWNFVWRKGTN